MTAIRNWALAATIASMNLMGVVEARAQASTGDADPAVWLRKVYELYHRAERSLSPNNQPSTGLVVKRASKSLAALFERDADCVAEGKGTCALDWDFVIDGQDWKLSNVQVGPAVVTGDKATVTVRFKNFVSCVNVYFFVREDGRWKVDDIETQSGKDAPIGIAKMLKDYDYSR